MLCFGLTDFTLLNDEVRRYQIIVDAENEMLNDHEVSGNAVNDANPSISSTHPDPFGHHRLYSELQSEQYELEENLRQWRLEQDID